MLHTGIKKRNNISCYSFSVTWWEVFPLNLSLIAAIHNAVWKHDVMTSFLSTKTGSVSAVMHRTPYGDWVERPGQHSSTWLLQSGASRLVLVQEAGSVAAGYTAPHFPPWYLWSLKFRYCLTENMCPHYKDQSVNVYCKKYSTVDFWGAKLHAESSRVRVPMTALNFFPPICLHLPAAPWPRVWLSLYQKWVPRDLSGGKARMARKTGNLTADFEPIVWTISDRRHLSTL
jgi:hypothetical protein